MDVTTILIGIAAFIISAVVIYVISVFSMREQTFEEVIEEQRRRQEEEREKIKAEKKAEREQTKKKYKKGKDKSKDKNPPVIETDIQVEPKMVNLEIEPEIIEPTETLGLTSVRNRGKKDKAGKSILHNRDEIPPVTEKAVDVYHKQGTPKDELELKKTHEKVVVEKIEKVRATRTEAQIKEKKPKMSTESKENLPPLKTEKDDSKSGKIIGQKLKSEEADKRSNKGKSSDADVPLNGTRVISFVKTAKLSDDEIQNLIDILLNKQGLTPSGPVMTDDSWNKKSQKGDPIFQLKKQLEEKERILQEEQKTSVSANARIKEIRSELLSEKSRYTAMEKQYQEKLLRHQADLDALHARMQKTHEQHMVESKSLQAKLVQMEKGGDKAAAQKMSDENKVLQETLSLKSKENATLGDKLKIVEKELASSKSKIQAAESSKKSLEAKFSSNEDKMKKMEKGQKEVDALVNQRVEEVAQALRKSEAKNSSFSSDLQKATGALTTAQGEVSALKSKLKELETHLTHSEENSERKRSDLEGNVKNLDKQLTDMSSRLSEKNTEVKMLQQDKQTLSTENKSISDKLQSAAAPNGDIHGDSDKMLSEKEKEIGNLTNSLEAQKKAVTSLQGQLDTQKAEVSDFQQQLIQQRAKNNALREKNWKAMEALEKSEKTSAEKVDRALKSARESGLSLSMEVESHDKAIFQRLFPDIQVGDKPHKEWMSLFEKQVSKKLSNEGISQTIVKQLEADKGKLQMQLSEKEKMLNANADRFKDLESKASQSSEDETKYKQLESDNNKLKSEVDKYQKIVAETENKLCQLEKSIDAEQKKWQEKLKEALSSANQDSGSGKEVQELQSTIDKREEQVSEYRRILALTEERLQSLGDKVVKEEQSWQNKLANSDKELKKVQGELASLKQELHASKGSQEVQGELASLKQELHASKGSQEMQDKTEHLQTVLTEKENTILLITKEKEEQMKEIKVQMDAEQKKSKDLSLNVVKLNGIIKTGHDALNQEQKLVKQLQEQLDSKSMASGISEIDDTDQAASTGENGTSV